MAAEDFSVDLHKGTDVPYVPLEEINWPVGLFEGFDVPDDHFIELDLLLDTLENHEKEQEVEATKTMTSKTPESNAGAAPKKVRRGGERKGKKTKARSSDNNKIKRRQKKMEWTPELHQKFVHAVEQAGGIYEAVPVNILKAMNVNFITRQMISSHLQKYKAHQKVLGERQIEAAKWNHQRRAPVVATEVGGKKMPWILPAVVYPPQMMTPMYQGHFKPLHQGHFRPSHMWGYPVWSTHKPDNLGSAHQTNPVPVVPGAPMTWPGHPPYWYQPPCYPQGYGVAPSNHSSIGVPTRPLFPFNLPLDIYPSNEAIEAALGDAITKPGELQLPIGLKLDSLDSIVTDMESQRVRCDVLPN